MGLLVIVMIKKIAFLILISSNCFADTFGYKSEGGTPELVISADLVKFDQIEIYPNSSESNYKHLNEFVLCATSKALDECYSQNTYGVTKGYRGDDRFLLGLKSLNVDGYIKWGDNVTYTVRYQSGKSKRTKKGLISFNCSGDKCYPLNSLSKCSYIGCSTSDWSVLATITSIYNDGIEIKDFKKSNSLSSFSLLSNNNSASVYMDIQLLKPEQSIAMQHQGVFKEIVLCMENGSCSENGQLSKLLGKNYESNLYAVHKFDNEKHKFSGLLHASSVFDIYKKSDSCKASLSVKVLDAQVIVAECKSGKEQFLLISQYKDGVFKYDYKTEYVVYLMATKAFSDLVKSILNSEIVPHQNTKFIQESPNLLYR